MSIPPFPSQDLAKLVLGYLAEEQLMTAYDEFLQASPYLDALRNEYDRIFMTSLKSILAEYRAVKIYVDTCKPFALRKKVFQCTNLLDVVKFLVANVDIKKIQQQEAPEKTSLEKQSITITQKPNTCELCHSLSLLNCVCKNVTDVQNPEASASYVEASTLQNSVEATPLADLPGNHVTTRKKHVKIVERDGMLVNSNGSSLQNDSSAKQSFSSNISPEEYLARCENSPVLKSSDATLSLNSTVKPLDPSKSNQNIEEFNNVLKSVVNRNKTFSGSECSSNQRVSNAGTFQDFASGVAGGESHSATYNIPDSSTSENSNVRVPFRKDVYNDNIKGPPQPQQRQLMLQVRQVNDTIEIQTCKPAKLPKLLPRTLENQIKIISDVKVDNKLTDKISKKKPLVSTNATSTPMMQMQTIMINGTPIYKHTSNTFTKDEIMAMPTLIVVPASGPSQVPTSACNTIMTSNNNVISETNSSPRILGPLVIDVPPNTAISNKPKMEALPDLSEQNPITGDLVKTVAVKSSSTTASVPKDNVISFESNTPQVLPPTRKSSSTPRRTSHIRVLDFATPRRILHETINEQVPSQSSDPLVEIAVSGSENSASAPATAPETIDIKTKITVAVNEEGNNNDTGSTKENEAANKTKQAKKYDWDADLRALVANEKPSNISHRKPKSKTSKKKKSDKTPAIKDSEIKKKKRSKKSPRVKKSTGENVEELDDDEPTPNMDKTCNVPCKPTVKIVYDKMKDLQEAKTDSNKNKSHEKTDELTDTPETERLSLQNVIGAKLNISDFLETPYKQALYDIQMETPRFLGPDLPDEPLSDIKIMNIPTPRFLNTPKPAHATPSSYSSRPTDYSSGGSYYKPDDQDYMPIPDLTTCPVTSSKEDLSVEKSTEKDSDEKKSRPVRKCAKNVSYYKSSGAVKKDVEDNIDATSSCSDTISANSSHEFKSKKETTIIKTPRAKAQATSRSDSRKRSSASKKRKSPKNSVNDKTKAFMKIKPRFTPKKSSPMKNGKKMVHSPHSRGFPTVPQRKRTTSKDRLVNSSSLIVPAATKSRRKSSTPRKLQCTKTFTSEVCGHDSPDNIPNVEPDINRKKNSSITQDSDTEQIALRWSDEGSEEGKPKDVSANPISKETEDITQIQEFIVSTGVDKSDRINDGTLQRDLMKRGFDLETAKIIERDLLDDTPLRTETTNSSTLPISVQIVETKEDGSVLDKTTESSTNVTTELQIAQDESDDEIALSAHECNEKSNNYFVFEHDYTKEVSQEPPIKIKDNFTMEICIDDVTMRLKAPPFKLVLDQDPLTVDEIDYSYKETEQAVSSIIGMERLYTPLKDTFKSQCYEIFDSTLTSIDTPLKTTSPVKNACDATVTELVLEGEKTEPKEITEAKKRKRARSSSNESANSSKRTKPDADLLLKAANIQNIDIETVLTKLHGH